MSKINSYSCLLLISFSMVYLSSSVYFYCIYVFTFKVGFGGGGLRWKIRTWSSSPTQEYISSLGERVGSDVTTETKYVVFQKMGSPDVVNKEF